MKVLLTDRPWPDTYIERSIFEEADIELVDGSTQAPSEAMLADLVRRINPAAILTCWAPITSSVLEAATDLKIVARFGIGVDNVDVDSATRRRVFVTNVPEYCTEDVADHAAALTLASLRGVVEFDRQAKLGIWRSDNASLDRIADLVVGIVGYGKIGRALGQRLKPFGCRILAYSPSGRPVDDGIEVADLETIQTSCSVIILLAPLTPQTVHLVGRDFLQGCRQRPLIVNVSRGALVDNEALLEALASEHVRGAAFDVVEGEPSPPLQVLQHPSVVVTPHIAYLSNASLTSLRRQASEEIVRALSGKTPLHICNRP